MPNKALGQHWLTDRDVLGSIADEAGLTPTDHVLEIGPGLGTLTSVLLRRAASVTAVEFDAELARKLPGQFPGTDLTVHHEDFLEFDLNSLPKGYKVVANVPYYITAKIIQRLLAAANKPAVSVLLVQKEVAERLAAQPGAMSILAISAQLNATVTLGPVVKAVYFTPPPKVDSQVVVLTTRTVNLLDDIDESLFYRFVKAGFSERRKKLRSSLSGGLRMSKDEVGVLLQRASISGDVRAQDLSIEQWLALARSSTG
jgi:16S rRNA (adenine1518-N6/adenine1519-N6)-dimethyltransferase